MVADAMAKKEKLKDVLEGLFEGRLAAVKAGIGECGGDVCLTLGVERLREAAAVLKEAPEAAFDFLACLTAVDRWPSEPRFEIVYHLRSLSAGHRLVVKVRLPGDFPAAPSVTDLWAAADWFEREAFDLLGITFTGHPDLRRLLLPPDWEGHPLRKDYPLEGTGRQPDIGSGSREGDE